MILARGTVTGIMSLEVMTKVMDMEEISQSGGKSVKINEGQ